MYRLTGPASPGRGGRFMDTADTRPKADGHGKSTAETPTQYRRRRRRIRRAA